MIFEENNGNYFENYTKPIVWDKCEVAYCYRRWYI